MGLYRIYVARKEDMNQGSVWIGGCGHLRRRSVLKLTAKDTGKTVYCEMLSIDEDPNFLNDYNSDKNRIPISDDPKSALALVASEWYREKLGVEKNTEVEIDVAIAKWWENIYFDSRACLDHPQIALRFPARLGIWSVIFGVLGFIFGVVGIILGIVSLILGIVSLILGIVSLCKN